MLLSFDKFDLSKKRNKHFTFVIIMGIVQNCTLRLNPGFLPMRCHIFFPLFTLVKKSWLHLFFVFCFCFTLYYPFREIGLPYPGKATAAARAALIPSPTNACWIFSCFRNPPNSDINCRIFNVRTCVRACTHRGLGTPTMSQHNIFDSEKLSQFFFLCSWRRRDSNLRSLDLGSDALATEPPRHPPHFHDGLWTA